MKQNRVYMSGPMPQSDIKKLDKRLAKLMEKWNKK